MYLAELRGKLSKENENKEDILTSNVFSFFKYTDRIVFLSQFLREIGLNITDADAINAEFYFWPSFDDHTEPDLVIITGDYYLLIEAKFTSGFGQETKVVKHQLVREIQGGRCEANNLDKTFKILAVTADYYQPTEFAEKIPSEDLSDFKWINWQSITFFIDQILQSHPKLSHEMKLLANDLYRLLLKKNLRNFEGIKALDVVKKLIESPEQIFFEASTASYRGDFIGFKQALGMKRLIVQTPEKLFFDASSATFRGDFIGFSHMLLHDQQLQTSPGNIFFTATNQQRFFLLRSDNLLKSQNGRIFFRGGQNE